jgi:hypothetical protein
VGWLPEPERSPAGLAGGTGAVAAAGVGRVGGCSLTLSLSLSLIMQDLAGSKYRRYEWRTCELGETKIIKSNPSVCSVKTDLPTMRRRAS